MSNINTNAKFHELIAMIKPNHVFFENLMVSQKFDLGTQFDVGNMSDASHREFTRPPYPISLFQMEESTNKNVHFFLFNECYPGEKVLRVVCFTHYESGQWSDHGVVFVAAQNDNNFMYAMYKDWDLSVQLPSIEIEKWDMSNPLCWIIEAIERIVELFEVLNCSNVYKEENKPPKFINAKRAAKGKIPFFSYWTVHIRQKEKSIENCGGTHASPRLHLRRGHIRRLANGVTVWVTHCLVGNKSLGIVQKDYKLAA